MFQFETSGRTPPPKTESEAIMSKMQRKNLSQPDEVRTFDKGKVELTTLGGVTFGRATMQPGWKWSTCVKPIVKTNSCEAAHLQYVISGRMAVVMDDGSQMDFGAGDMALIPPGHDAWVLGSEPLVAIDITGMGEYARPHAR
jgi:mannose-6-phosphate isomerase-like protein (cupin superfamily)